MNVLADNVNVPFKKRAILIFLLYIKLKYLIGFVFKHPVRITVSKLSPTKFSISSLSDANFCAPTKNEDDMNRTYIHYFSNRNDH